MEKHKLLLTSILGGIEREGSEGWKGVREGRSEWCVSIVQKCHIYASTLSSIAFRIDCFAVFTAFSTFPFDCDNRDTEW